MAILSTGDELVEPGRPIDYGQIRDTNSYTLFGAMREAGAAPFLGGIVRDDVDELRDAVLGLVSRADVFVCSGGVSVGRARRREEGVLPPRATSTFYRVAMQPGMPQGFGNVEGRPYFGLPGNPVSVFVSFELFIRPALLKMMGRRDLLRPEVEAELVEDISGPREQDGVRAGPRPARRSGRWVAKSTGAGAVEPDLDGDAGERPGDHPGRARRSRRPASGCA